MHLRRILTTVGTIAAAGIMALLPTAAHAATSVTANGTTVTTPVAIDGYLKSATANFAGFNVGCSAGSVAGDLTNGSPNPAPGFVFDSLNLTCDSFIPGGTVSMNLDNCDIPVNMTGAATSGVNTAVTGTANMSSGSTNCVTVTITPPGCTLEVGATIAVSFNETIKTVGGVNYQELTLSGNTLRLRNATGLCAFFVPNNTAITLNAVFNVRLLPATTGTGINFS